MQFTQIISDIVLGLTAICSLFFLVKIVVISWKHKRYWPFSAKNLPPDERFMITKYRIRLTLIFFSGLGIFVLLDYVALRK